MRAPLIISLLLATACLLAGPLGWAQRPAVAPLMPATPVVVLPTPKLGVEIQPKKPAAPASTAASPQAQPGILWPLCIINGRYLTSMSVLNAINPQQITKLDIYKQGSGPMQWRSLTAAGLVSLALKTKPRIKLQARSLAAIKRGLKLRGPVRFELNGAPIQDESLQLVADAIAGFDITRAAPQTAAATVVNIRLVPYTSQPTVHPPGTIMIRGLAQH
ncbi:hypothetical protein HHL22_12135 [Hymenobacter sp. RP-2-7]|uniref:Uncharacterized protein n=1 Tax=Hymenobacter polaris TaxID=2682546 RepID=A0A7Y0FN01_9BACT|nr:hypothetical protein [Hymenobacter polaris]NML65954.1 hypothetical protein [Hymenobacter polaris]